MQSRLPKRNLAACTSIEADANWFLASILTVFAAERFFASGSRVATCAGIRPLSHPAVRQPGSPDKMALIPSGADRRALLFVFRSPGAEDPSRAEEPFSAGPRGNFERH